MGNVEGRHPETPDTRAGLGFAHDYTKARCGVDERDRLICDRSPRTQWIAVILTLAVWVIGLTLCIDKDAGRT
jgi:hypothetical protein